MLPQIKFYDLQVQLFGLSNWNSEKLLRLSRDELEGALFPREAYHGTDKAVYESLKTKLEESGVTEVSPVTVSGYFGTRLILEALGDGASSREDVQTFLDARLRGTANDRLREANALSILVVRRGRVREFRPPTPSDL
jgi:hypothetical protein